MHYCAYALFSPVEMFLYHLWKLIGLENSICYFFGIYRFPSGLKGHTHFWRHNQAQIRLWA